MIFITTSNGVFRLGAEDPAAQLVLARRRGFWLLRRGSGGFFGIAPHPDGDSCLAVSRERLGTVRRGKPWTDARLYRIWPDAQRSPRPVADLKDIHDVHQIATSGRLVLLTDTGLNRLRVHDLDTGRSWNLDVGPERTDINHLNALHAGIGQVLVGLNNRGAKPAEILTLDLALVAAPPAGADALQLGQVEALGRQLHTHDIEPFGDDFLYCASHDGRVHRRSTLQAILHCGDWARGLAVNADGLWVGASALADRSSRHREDLDGQVHLYDPESLELKRSWQLTGAGQVNDILAW